MPKPLDFDECKSYYYHKSKHILEREVNPETNKTNQVDNCKPCTKNQELVKKKIILNKVVSESNKINLEPSISMKSLTTWSNTLEKKSV